MTCNKWPGPTGLNYTPLIDTGTLCLWQSQLPGPLYAQQYVVDELTPIASFMCAEINSNSSSISANRMRGLNSYSAKECIKEYQELPLWRQLFSLGITPDICIDREISYPTAALLIWAGKVMQGSDWDHKPIISRRFNSRNLKGQQHWHLYGNTLFYYDVWSNIHYGYVGLASGFSEDVLLDGAGLEQIGSTLSRGAMPTKSPNVAGLKAWDDNQDRAGVQIGMQLYKSYPSNLTVQALLAAVLQSNYIAKKPYSG